MFGRVIVLFANLSSGNGEIIIKRSSEQRSYKRIKNKVKEAIEIILNDKNWSLNVIFNRTSLSFK
jgi:hypothetical protein